MPPTVRNYRDLIVWQRAIELVANVYSLTQTFPADERFGLVAQMRRAAVSIPLNIAEGHGRATRGEYLNQLSVARGSLNELETLCEVCDCLAVVEPARLSATRGLVSEISRMTVRLQQALRRVRPHPG